MTLETEKERATDNELGILIVDDDKNARRTLAVILDRQGYGTETAKTGQEALEKAQQRSFNAILLNTKLPNAEGIDILTSLKDTHPHIAIIMVADHTSVETAMQALNNGASTYITKPLNANEVLATIKESLEKQQLIEEKRQVERALQDSEERLLLILEGVTLGVWDWNVQTGKMTFNERWATMLGYTPEEIEPHIQSWEALVHPDDMPNVQKALNAHLEGHTPYYETEHRMRAKSGDWIWMLARGRVIERDGEGKPLRAAGTHLDITERKQMEKKLRKSEERFRTVFEKGPLGMAILSPDDRFMQVNAQLCQMVGYTEEELRKLTFYDITHPDDIETSRQFAQQLRNCEIPVAQTEKRYITKNGRVKWINVIATFVHSDDGVPIYKLAMIKDITKHKQAEEELSKHRQRLENLISDRTTELNRRVAEMEQLNRAMANLLEDLQATNRNLERTTRKLQAANEELESFAYVVSHDLKAPLRGIIQLTSWLSEDYTDVLDKNGQEMLSLLIGRAKRLHQLVEGILTYSRVGRVKERERDVDLEQLVPETIQILTPPESIEVSIEGMLPTVLGEPTRLRQVFQNLIGNAIKFMDRAPGHVIVRCQDKGAHWLFSVADNGPGIEDKYYDKIFQMFQTLTPRDKVEGTGVGLALVKKIVETWNGDVWVESTAGEGSTFYFTLPKSGKE